MAAPLTVPCAVSLILVTRGWGCDRWAAAEAGTKPTEAPTRASAPAVVPSLVRALATGPEKGPPSALLTDNLLGNRPESKRSWTRRGPGIPTLSAAERTPRARAGQ